MKTDVEEEEEEKEEEEEEVHCAQLTDKALKNGWRRGDNEEREEQKNVSQLKVKVCRSDYRTFEASKWRFSVYRRMLFFVC